MSGYHNAQICKNGHVITSYADHYTYAKENYCSKCGSETITKCLNCSSNIRGREKEYGYLGEYKAPSYCYNCGKPYPWTKASLEAAQELLALENILSPNELDYFNENMSSILVDTPKSKVIATKLKIFINKASSVVGSTLKDIIVEIGSETAKKIILGE